MGRIGALLVVLCFFARAVAADETKSTKRFLGNGIEILSGDGTRAKPFNKPPTGHRILENAMKHRALKKENLHRELKAVSEDSPMLERIFGRGNNRNGRRLQDGQSNFGTSMRCWEYEESQNLEPFGDLTGLHPCFNEQCSVRKSSTGCLDLVYDFCCDTSLEDCSPSADMMSLRSQATCEPQECSSFMRDTSSTPNRNPDIDFSLCIFSDTTVCDQCLNQMWQLWDSYVFNSCEWDKNCLRNLVWSYDPSVAQMQNRFVKAASQTRSAVHHRGLQEGDAGPYEEGGGFEENFDNLECSQQTLVELINNMERAGVYECTGALEETTCGGLNSCMPSIAAAVNMSQYGFDAGPEENPLLSCVIVMTMTPDFGSLWPSMEPMPSEDRIFYYQNLYLAFGECEDGGSGGPDGGNGPGGNGPDATEWNFDGACKPESEEVAVKCGKNCCAMHNRFLEFGDVRGFPTDPEDAGFQCGELVRSGADSSDVFRCLRTECSGCYDELSGIYGPPEHDELEDDNPYRGQCVETIYNHCVENPHDEHCRNQCPFQDCDTRDGSCPCDQGTCQAFYNATFGEAHKCKQFYNQVKTDFVAQGFLFPENEWERESLMRKGVVFDNSNNNTFMLLNTTLSIALVNECGLVEEIVDCMQNSVEFCNSNKGWWSPGCRALSTCGDGEISWGEECDDGNDNKFEDGCRDCHWVPNNWFCPAPGVPCETCLQDERISQQNYRPGVSAREQGTEGAQICPFCLNEKIPGLTSPCLQNVCESVNDYWSAVACDEMVFEYCAALLGANLHDPGCENYQNRSITYGVPQINRCRFKIREVDVHGRNLKKMKFGIIECPVVDPTGQGKDTTPMTPYWAPLHGLSTQDLSDLDPTTKNALELLAIAEKDVLVPLTALTDHETNAYHDVDIHKENQPIAEWGSPYKRTARLMMFQDPEMHHDNEWCDHPQGQVDMTLIPPCDDPMAAVARQSLQEMKFRAVHNDDYDFEDFEEVDLDDLASLECNPMSNVVQFSIRLSRTRLEWRDGRESPYEQKEMNCERYASENGGNWPPWHEQENLCDSVEDALRSGQALVSFGDRLFQQGCLSKDCDQAIASCKLVPLTSERSTVDIEQFTNKVELLKDAILSLEEANSWGSIKKRLIEVSALAASRPIAGALDIFRSVTLSGEITRMMRDVRDFCPHDWWTFNETLGTYEQNAEWQNDPCCNWELRAYLCCPVQNVPNGKINTIIGFDESSLEICQNPDRIKQTFADLFTTIADSQKLASNFAEKADPRQYERIWEIEDECREKIYDRNKDINSQADCYCTYSTFQESTSECKVGAAEEPLCFAQCFREKFESENPYILHYLKEQWGISVPESSDVAKENLRFAEKWREEMTEPGCEGEEAWHSDIGWAGFYWTCNTTCQEEHACDYWSAMDVHLRILSEASESQYSVWEVSNSDSLCAEVGGTRSCQYSNEDGSECWEWRCNIPAVEQTYEMPCSKAEACREECYETCQSQAGCEAANGTWINDKECCPAEAYVHESEWNPDEKHCKSIPPGKPNSWDLFDELCCAAEGGNWRRTEWGGECCLAEWVKREWEGYSWWECREWVDTWQECHNCEQEHCEPLRDDCNTCYKGRNDCCGEVYQSQNQSACLSYTRCNDRSIQDDASCVGDDAFCTNEWGWPESRSATCRVQIDWHETNKQAVCEGLGFTWKPWEWGDGGDCVKEMAPGDSPGACFNETVCPIESWTDMFPGWEEPANGYFGGHQCPNGCHINDSSNLVTNTVVYPWGWKACQLQVMDPSTSNPYNFNGEWNPNTNKCIIHEWWIQRFADEDFFGTGLTQAEVCNELGGDYNSHYITFETSRFETGSQCSAGYCRGSINNHRRHPDTGRWHGDQPWSEEQCFSLSEKSCDRWCPQCKTFANDFGTGGCFSVNDLSLDENLDEIACLNTTNYTWYSCSQPEPYLEWHEVDSICSDTTHMPEGVANALNCRQEWDRCDSEEKCRARGHCQGVHGHIDFQTYQCLDESWTHGDTFWAYEEVENNGVTTSQWVECPFASRKSIEGVCIGDRDAHNGCGQNKWHLWHQFGCKKEGLYNGAECEVANYTWYAKIRKEEDCVVEGCKLNRWDFRMFDDEQCESCGGETVNMARWEGGNVIDPYSLNFRWHPNGREMAPVNQWIGRQQGYLVKEQLAVPSMRSFAQYKKSELLVTYNTFSKVLETIACDCSGGANDGSVCFAAQGDGALSTQQDLPGGRTTEAGSGVFVETTVQSRRLLQESDTNTSSVSVTEYSAGIFDKHEPCTGEDASTLDAFAVTNKNGLVIGQLIGNGRGVNVTGAVTSVIVCMPARADIVLRDDLFSVYAAAKRNEDGTITAMTFADDAASYEERSASQVCVAVEEDGVFFPVARVPDNLMNSTKVCSSCEHGTCVLSKNDAAMCVCKCGFSGASCDTGCPFYCNSRGSCDAQSNSCTCNMGNTVPLYTGDACGKMNCPTNSNGVQCSGNGLCSVETGDPECTCAVGFEGANCGTETIGDTTGAETGFGGTSQPPSPGFSFGNSNGGGSSPTSPTPQQTAAPTLETNLNGGSALATNLALFAATTLLFLF